VKFVLSSRADPPTFEDPKIPILRFILSPADNAGLYAMPELIEYAREDEIANVFTSE
jgi:hypothetical protein